MPLDAPTMDVLRKQAIAMAMLWFTARDYQTDGGHAWFHIRASDLGLREDVLPGMKIAVRIDCQPDSTAGVQDLVPTPDPDPDRAARGYVRMVPADGVKEDQRG